MKWAGLGCDLGLWKASAWDRLSAAILTAGKLLLESPRNRSAWASKLERPEEEKVVHVAERNSFHPFDFRVGGSRFRVVRESFRGDVPEQRRKSEEGTFEPAQWPHFTFSSPVRLGWGAWGVWTHSFFLVNQALNSGWNLSRTASWRAAAHQVLLN